VRSERNGQGETLLLHPLFFIMRRGGDRTDEGRGAAAVNAMDVAWAPLCRNHRTHARVPSLQRGKNANRRAVPSHRLKRRVRCSPEMPRGQRPRTCG
jgi:hypothetical protein